MSATFEVYELTSGKFSFRLRAADGEIVASGEEYETRADAELGCESVQRAAKDTELGAGSMTVDHAWPASVVDVVLDETPDDTDRFGFFGMLSEGPDLSERVDEVLRDGLRRTG